MQRKQESNGKKKLAAANAAPNGGDTGSAHRDRHAHTHTLTH